MTCYENLICRCCVWYDDINVNGCYLSDNCLLYNTINDDIIDNSLDYNFKVSKTTQRE